MRETLLLSLRLHLLWFSEALESRGRYLAPLGICRLLVLLFLFPFFLAVQACHWLGFLLDEIFFRDYREVEIKEPLIITGVPRGGTTFVHRAVARDTEQFTSMELWEAMLAPSIIQRKLIKQISSLDRKVGNPLHRLLDVLIRYIGRRFPHINDLDLHAHHEDYLTLLPAGGCSIMILVFPASRSLWQLGRFQEFPDHERKMLVGFYKACLQKHLYLAPPGRRLLTKNAGFGSWLPDLRFAFPDARHIFCIRDPRASLSSQLSAIRDGIEFFGTTKAADTYSLEFQTVFAHVYRILLDEKQSFLVDRLVITDFDQLRKRSASILEASLKQLCVPVTATLKESFRAAAADKVYHKAEHDRSQLTEKTGPDEFNSLVRGIYEEILAHPNLTSEDIRPRSRKGRAT